jgi:hypothetical protein
MLKYFLFPLLFLTLGFSTPTVTTDDEPSGKVTAIEGNVVTMEVTGELPAWAKKGGYLKATDADGKVVLRGAKISKAETGVIAVSTPKAKDMVVGGVYKLARGKAAAGC